MITFKEIARELRRNETPSERIFWEMVRNRRLYGLKFSRQVPIFFEYDGEKRFVVLDLYCAEKKLGVEIDGDIHNKRLEMDDYRTLLLNIMGIYIVRFRNEELDDIESVKSKLLEAKSYSPPDPPSLSG